MMRKLLGLVLVLAAMLLAGDPWTAGELLQPKEVAANL